MMHQVSGEWIEKWLTGWSVSRGLPLPEQWQSGYKVKVGQETQKERYVFPQLNNDFIRLAQSVDEPWIHLKVCASYKEFRDLIPERWQLQPQGYMMKCSVPMTTASGCIGTDYSLNVTEHKPDSFIVNVRYRKTEQAAIGRLIIIDGLAVYDRIRTESNHQRKGLAALMMKSLESIALSKGITAGLLVATEQGKPLYESLGWEMYSVYTSVLIPEVIKPLKESGSNKLK